jgi:hypothetical protein
MNAKWFIAIPLFGIFVLCIGANAWLITRYARHRLRPADPRPGSMIFWIGGIFGWFGVVTIPIGTQAERLWYSWIPLVLDFTWPYTAVVFPYVLGREYLERFGVIRSGAGQRGTESGPDGE